MAFIAPLSLGSHLKPSSPFQKFTPTQQQERGMAKLKELKLRIRSVQSIKKITASMKMVAASKLRVVQNRMELGRPFFQSADEIFSKRTDALGLKYNNQGNQKHLIVAITSDKGLCGSINSSIIKTIRPLIRHNPETTKLIICGEKGKAGLVKEFNKNITYFVSELGGKKPLGFHDVVPLTEKILSQDWDICTIFFTKFVSVLVSTPIQKIIVPRSALKNLNFSQYEFEPEDNAEVTLANYHAFHLSASLFQALMESATSELGARMTSMENATKNAGEMINSLSLKFNRGRQAAITTELTEIISGAQAIEVSAD